MSTLRSALCDYISMRRGLGYKFIQPEQRLGRFIAFMERRRASVVTREVALEWAMQPPDRRATWSLRLSDVRGFAHYLRNIDLRHEVPASGILPFPVRRKPYLYTDVEIADLLTAAFALPPSKGLRRWTYHCLLGLLAVSGLRISEALNLQRKDVDLENGVVTIRDTKFGKYAGRQTMPIAAAVNGADRENSCIRAKSHSHVSRHSYAYRPSRNVRSLPCGRYRPALLA